MMLFYFCLTSMYLLCNAQIPHICGLWCDWEGSTNGWSITVSGLNSLVQTIYDTKCPSSPCLLIQAGGKPDRYAYVTRTFSGNYEGLQMIFSYYHNGLGTDNNRDCYFQYSCNGINYPAQSLKGQSQQTVTNDLSNCDRKGPLTIILGCKGGNGNKGKAFIDTMHLKGSVVTTTTTTTTRKPATTTTTTTTRKPATTTTTTTPKPATTTT
eukprot:507151_1